MIRLETNRLRIREYQKEDLTHLHRILSDQETMSFWPSPFDFGQSKEWLVHRGLELYPSGFGRFAVELKDSGELIGDAGLLRIEMNGDIENDLGYIVHSNYWGHGFGYEAAYALMRYGFETLRLTRICANMPANHVASRNVALKLGMVLEKQFLNPRNRDILTYLYAKEN